MLAVVAMLCGTAFAAMGATMLLSMMRYGAPHPVGAAIAAGLSFLVASLFGLAGYRVLTGRTSRRYHLGPMVRWAFGGFLAVGAVGLLVRAGIDGSVWLAAQAFLWAFLAYAVVRSGVRR